MNNNHQHIDALVRERIQTLPPATPPQGGWDALQRELDGDADLLLRSALNGLAAGAAPVGWEALERKLNPQTTADGQLAKRLNALSPAPPTGWEKLAARLDHENDVAVDAIVTDGLARTAPNATSGWAALAARLELIGWRRNTVAAWKLTECCLLLSLLLLFLRFGPTTPSNPTFAELAEGFPIPIYATSDSGGNVQSLATEQESMPAVVAADLTESPAPAAITIEQTKTEKRVASPIRTPLRSGVIVSNQAVSLLPAAPDVYPYTLSSTPDLKIVETAPSREDVYLPDNVATLAINQLNSRLFPPSPALILPRQVDAEPIYYFLNAFVSPVDFNEVVTPATEISEFDVSSDSRITYGKSAGLLFEVMQGNNGLQLGLIYSRRSYIPTALKWWRDDEYTPTEPFFDGGYTRFVYDATELQFNYKRTLLKTEKWRVSGRVGMGLNLVAYTDFDDQEKFVRQFNDFLVRLSEQPVDPDDPNGTGGSRSRRSEAEERLLKKPAAGFLEGGGVFDNSSLYFNGGFIIERLIDQRWSFYVAPTFGRAIYLREDQGIGPYKDRINPAGLRFGSRYHFGGK